MTAAGSGWLVGAQLGQHAVGRFWVQEGNKLPRRSVEGFVMDQAHAGAGRLGKLGGDVISAKGDVMNPLAAVGQELGNRAFRRGRLEQFQMNASDIKECRPHLLGGNLLAVFTAQPERFFINRHRLVERANRDAKVIDVINHFL